MSIACLLLGESGTGKTTSMRNMNPDNCLLIQVVRKPLPFRAQGWSYLSKENPNGNILVTDQWNQIIQTMTRTRRDVVIIDDLQYVLANEYMRRSSETGYQKFTDIGRSAWEIFTAASQMPDNKRVYFMSHTQIDDFGNVKAKTIGKMLDEKITVEGLFTIVLRTAVDGQQYQFCTRNSGHDTVKSPIGLFDAERIDNDLDAVDAAICSYYCINPAHAE